MSNPSDLCEAKHTLVDVNGDDFCCPKCKAKSGDFYVDGSPNDECTKLHAEDDLHCGLCGYTTTGAAFVRRYMKEKDLVPCPCCGTGAVPSKKAAEYKEKMG